MAIAASMYWRIRLGGNNANGGGYDASASSAATGSNLTWATSGGVTTVTDTVAAAFTTGMVNASIEIAGVVQVKILTRVDASNLTVTPFPPWIAQNSGGAKYNWTVGAGTDYSQQDSPQVTFNGTTITATTAGVSATITITGYTVAATDVDNVLHIAGGTNFTVGWYTIISTGAGTWTLDRNCTTGAGAAMTGRMGGGWADHVNLAGSSGGAASAAGPTVAGNTSYILGGASPSYVSPDYTFSDNVTPPNGSTTAGLWTVAGDPATPTTNGFSGYPLIKITTNGTWLYNTHLWSVHHLFIFSGIAAAGGIFNPQPQNTNDSFLYSIVYDQNGYDAGITGSNNGGVHITACEVFSSAAKRATNAKYGIGAGQFNDEYQFCNVHDTIGPGVQIDNSGQIADSIVAKCGGDSVTVGSAAGSGIQSVTNLTIDGSTGNGIVFSTQAALSQTRVQNCIISNHTTAGKYAITVSAGTQAANDRVKALVDYNVLYNNAGNYNAISPGAHDTVLSSDPYVGQSTENYTLKPGVLGTTNAFPGATFPQHGSGQTATVQSYIYPGAVQPQQPTVVVNTTIENYLTEAA